MDDDFDSVDEGDDLMNWENEQVFQDTLRERDDMDKVTCLDCGDDHYTVDCPDSQLDSGYERD